MTEVPAWSLGVVSILSAIVGTLIKPIFGFVGNHENRLWSEIGRLNGVIDSLAARIDKMQVQHDAEIERIIAKYEAEIAHIRHQKHAAQGEAQAAVFQVTLLMMEVNKLLEIAEKPPRYTEAEMRNAVGAFPAGANA